MKLEKSLEKKKTAQLIAIRPWMVEVAEYYNLTALQLIVYCDIVQYEDYFHCPLRFQYEEDAKKSADYINMSAETFAQCVDELIDLGLIGTLEAKNKTYIAPVEPDYILCNIRLEKAHDGE